MKSLKEELNERIDELIKAQDNPVSTIDYLVSKNIHEELLKWKPKVEKLYMTMQKMVGIVESVWKEFGLKPQHKKAKEIEAAMIYSVIAALG